MLNLPINNLLSGVDYKQKIENFDFMQERRDFINWNGNTSINKLK